MRLARKQSVRYCLFAAVVAAAALLLPLLSSCGGDGGGGSTSASGPPRDTTPVVAQISQPGTAVHNDEKAVMDWSNAADGYFCVMSNLGDTKVKVLVNVVGKQYQYTISAGGSYIAIPLSEGNGTYEVGVWQNISGDQYAAIFSENIDANLKDARAPFLAPSQYVSYAPGDAAMSLSQQVSTGSVGQVDVINKVYKWVCENVTYDTAKATTVASGYLPNNTNTINSKTGICFDYAVLTASMLRAQQIPARLVIGYAGSAYHAWIDVACTDTGKVYSYEFNGNGEFQRMDPTFDAASRGSQDLSAVIGNGNNYNPMFYY